MFVSLWRYYYYDARCLCEPDSRTSAGAIHSDSKSGIDGDPPPIEGLAFVVVGYFAVVGGGGGGSACSLDLVVVDIAIVSSVVDIGIGSLSVGALVSVDLVCCIVIVGIVGSIGIVGRCHSMVVAATRG